MTRAIIGTQELSSFIDDILGTGRMILLRYGPGSGGDILLKELLKGGPPGSTGIFLSTYETIEEIGTSLGNEHHINIETHSLMDHNEDVIDRTLRKDRFMTEGIMVTDLLEVSMSDRPMRVRKTAGNILSEITSTSSKQVLPFTFVLDSIDDLLEEYDASEVITRLVILRRTLKTIGGIAIIGASSALNALNGREMRLFDCILEAEAVHDEGVWGRRMRLLHMRGDPSLPQEWPIQLS